MTRVDDARARSRGRRSCRRPRARRSRAPRRSRTSPRRRRRRSAFAVTTMWSAYSVPRMTSLSKPAPPSTETGAFMLYSTWFVPEPVRMSLSAAVEKPFVSLGIAIWSCGVDPDDVAVVGGRGGRRIAVGGRRVAVVLLRLREREAADDEQVVVVAALEPQRRLVRVDGEHVVALVALGDERLRRARAEPAARGRDGRRRRPAG